MRTTICEYEMPTDIVVMFQEYCQDPWTEDDVKVFITDDFCSVTVCIGTKEIHFESGGYIIIVTKEAFESASQLENIDEDEAEDNTIILNNFVGSIEYEGCYIDIDSQECSCDEHVYDWYLHIDEPDDYEILSSYVTNDDCVNEL